VDTRDESFLTSGLTGSAGTGVGDVYWKETAHCYTYVVGGRSYYSKNYCFGGWSERVAASYCVGERVTVFYDPRDPGQAVLKRGVTFGALFGLVLIFIGCIDAVWLMKG